MQAPVAAKVSAVALCRKLLVTSCCSARFGGWCFGPSGTGHLGSKTIDLSRYRILDRGIGMRHFTAS